MRDALAGELVERAMQRDRIRRGQRAVDAALSATTTPMVPMLAAAMAERCPDLAREGGDRGLAAGAGDGGDRRRLARIESRRGQRQRAARIRRRATNGDARSGSAADDRRRPRPRPPRSPAAMKRAPSALVPASAKNRSPGFTARLSAASPVTSIAPACGRIAASSLKRSRSLIVVQSGRRSSQVDRTRLQRRRGNSSRSSQIWRDQLQSTERCAATGLPSMPPE